MRPYFKHKLLLASQSPRRRQLLTDSGFNIEFIQLDVEETFPETLREGEIPLYLAEKKNKSYSGKLGEDELLITADTVVWIDNMVLNKPENQEEARRMLKLISGNKHSVYTGVCIRSESKLYSFVEKSDVYFSNLTGSIIDYYLNNYKPFDKAGAYGIQEFIGYLGIRRIEGCYYNVMGFPVSKFVEILEEQF